MNPLNHLLSMRQGQDNLSSSTSSNEPPESSSSTFADQSNLKDVGERERLLAYQIHEVLSLKEKLEELEAEFEKLSERSTQGDNSITSLERKVSADTALNQKIGEVADAAFWLISIPIILLTIVCIALIAIRLCVGSVPDIVFSIVGFVGLGGFVGLATYLWKLGHLNKRVERLEKQLDGLHDVVRGE